jgi:hypothetical protein
VGTVRAILTNTVGVTEGQIWDADDPLVRQHPEWFEASSAPAGEVAKSSQGSGAPLAEEEKAPPLAHRDTAPTTVERFEAEADVERERIKDANPAGRRQVPPTGHPVDQSGVKVGDEAPVEQATAAPGEKRSSRRTSGG